MNKQTLPAITDLNTDQLISKLNKVEQTSLNLALLRGQILFQLKSKAKVWKTFVEERLPYKVRTADDHIKVYTQALENNMLEITTEEEPAQIKTEHKAKTIREVRKEPTEEEKKARVEQAEKQRDKWRKDIEANEKRQATRLENEAIARKEQRFLCTPFEGATPANEITAELLKARPEAELNELGYIIDHDLSHTVDDCIYSELMGETKHTFIADYVGDDEELVYAKQAYQALKKLDELSNNPASFGASKEFLMEGLGYEWAITSEALEGQDDAYEDYV